MKNLWIVISCLALLILVVDLCRESVEQRLDCDLIKLTNKVDAMQYNWVPVTDGFGIHFYKRENKKSIVYSDQVMPSCLIGGKTH